MQQHVISRKSALKGRKVKVSVTARLNISLIATGDACVSTYHVLLLFFIPSVVKIPRVKNKEDYYYYYYYYYFYTLGSKDPKG